MMTLQELSILTEQETLQRAAVRLELSVSAKFVPFSQSRSKEQKDCNLNWKVTLQRNGRDIITTDYSAGQAHCPAHKLRKTPNQDLFWPLRFDQVQRAAISAECETGRAHVIGFSGHIKCINTPILPDECNVIYMFVDNSDVLNYSGFSDWADNKSYGSDSIKARAIYDDCLSIALNVKQAFTASEWESLQSACQDY